MAVERCSTTPPYPLRLKSISFSCHNLNSVDPKSKIFGFSECLEKYFSNDVFQSKMISKLSENKRYWTNGTKVMAVQECSILTLQCTIMYFITQMKSEPSLSLASLCRGSSKSGFGGAGGICVSWWGVVKGCGLSRCVYSQWFQRTLHPLQSDHEATRTQHGPSQSWSLSSWTLWELSTHTYTQSHTSHTPTCRVTPLPIVP